MALAFREQIMENLKIIIVVRQQRSFFSNRLPKVRRIFRAGELEIRGNQNVMAFPT